MICAGVQKPHWIAPVSMNAFCSGCSALGVPMPSIVVIDLPATCAASRVQELTATPSTITAQTPQEPSSQPCLTPRNPSRRSRSSRRIPGATCTVRG